MSKTNEVIFSIREVDYKSFARVVSTLEMETDELSEHLHRIYHNDEAEPYVLIQTIWQRLNMIGCETRNKNKTRILAPLSHDRKYFCINTGVQDADLYDIFLLLSNEKPYRTITWFRVKEKELKYVNMFDYMPSRCQAQRRKNSINFYKQHDQNEPIRLVIYTPSLQERIVTLCNDYCPSNMNPLLFFKARTREAFMRTRKAVNAFIAVDDGMSFGWMFPVSLEAKRPDKIHCFVSVRLSKSGRCYIQRVLLPDEGYCFANLSSVKISRKEPVLRNMIFRGE